MRGGANWLAFLLIPIAFVSLLYFVRFLVRQSAFGIRRLRTPKRSEL